MDPSWGSKAPTGFSNCVGFGLCLSGSRPMSSPQYRVLLRWTGCGIHRHRSAETHMQQSVARLYSVSGQGLHRLLSPSPHLGPFLQRHRRFCRRHACMRFQYLWSLVVVCRWALATIDTDKQTPECCGQYSTGMVPVI